MPQPPTQILDSGWMKSALPSFPSLTLSSGSRAFWQNKEARVPGQEQPHGPRAGPGGEVAAREHPQGDERGGVSELRQPEPCLAVRVGPGEGVRTGRWPHGVCLGPGEDRRGPAWGAVWCRRLSGRRGDRRDKGRGVGVQAGRGGAPCGRGRGSRGGKWLTRGARRISRWRQGVQALTPGEGGYKHRGKTRTIRRWCSIEQDPEVSARTRVFR